MKTSLGLVIFSCTTTLAFQGGSKVLNAHPIFVCPSVKAYVLTFGQTYFFTQDQMPKYEWIILPLTRAALMTATVFRLATSLLASSTNASTGSTSTLFHLFSLTVPTILDIIRIFVWYTGIPNNDTSQLEIENISQAEQNKTEADRLGGS